MPLKLNAFSGGSVTLNPATTTSDFTLTLPAATGTVVHADTNGNVGIGTASPNERLTIVTSNDAGISLQSLGSIQSALIRLIGRQSSTNEEWNIVATGSGLGAASLRFVRGGWTSAPSAAITGGGDFQFNSGYGSAATAYGCRAWVNFNGQGTVAIRSSGGVSSITDNGGTGNYTINLSFTMPDTNYCFVGLVRKDNAVDGDLIAINPFSSDTKTTTAVQIRTQFRGSSYGYFDPPEVNVVFFR